MHRNVVALLVGDRGRRRAAHQNNAVLFLGNLHHCQRGGGGDQFGYGIDVLAFNPFPCLVRGNVGLVLVVGGDHFNLEVGFFIGDEIIDRHFGGQYGTGTGQIGIGTGKVGQYTDFHGTA